MRKNKDLYSSGLSSKIEENKKKMNSNAKEHKAEIYLDTSIPSAYYDNEKPERQELTKEFWLKIKNTKAHVSELVKQELNQVESDVLRKKLLGLIDKFVELKITEEIKKLAEEYVKEKIIPERFGDDALHAAIATVNNMDFLLSWNFRHLVNVKTRQMVNLVNLKNGYKPIQIIAPPEFEEV